MRRPVTPPGTLVTKRCFQDQQQAVAATIRERLKLPEKQKSERDKKEDQLLTGVRKCSFPRYNALRRTSTLYVKHIEHSIV